jgi:hypothetical protein
MDAEAGSFDLTFRKKCKYYIQNMQIIITLRFLFQARNWKQNVGIIPSVSKKEIYSIMKIIL